MTAKDHSNPLPEKRQDTDDLIRRFNQFGSGELRNCPYCDTPIQAIKLYEKIEPEVFSLYVRPCGCRLGLWRGAPQWAKDANIPVLVVTNEDQDKAAAENEARTRIEIWNAKVRGKGGQL